MLDMKETPNLIQPFEDDDKCGYKVTNITTVDSHMAYNLHASCIEVIKFYL